MPRPQRTRVAPLSSKPAPKQSKMSTTKTTQKTTTTKQIARAAAASWAKSSSDSDVLGPQDVSDDNGLMMTGALREGDAPAVSTRRSMRGKSRASRELELVATAQDKDSSQDHLRSNTAVSASADGDAVPAPRREATPREDDTHEDITTDISLEPDSPQTQEPVLPQSGLSSRRTSVQRPVSVLRAFHTPGMDSSISALTRFKRRKRQGSIVSRMQRAGALGDSQLGTDVESQLDQTNLDLDDFDPDDESTPLHGTIMKDDIRTSSSRKRRYDGSPIDRTRSIVMRSVSPLSSPQHSDDLPEPESEMDHVPETAPPTQIEAAEHEDDAGEVTSTMAPPLSSSVIEPSSPLSELADEDGGRYRSIHMSTVELTSLLPKSRFRRNVRRGARDVFELQQSSTDITSDDIGADELELESPPISDDDEDQSFLTARQTRSRAAPTSATASRSKGNSNRSPARKQPAAIKKSAKDVTSKAKRKSYRQAVEDDKENEEDVSYAAEHDVLDDTTVIETAKTMKKMKDKFAEIDQFEMSFETVDVGGESSLWR